MSLLINIFLTVLLPLIIIAGIAYLLGRYRHLDPTPLANTAFYVLNPALVFVTMSTTAIGVDVLGRLFLVKLCTNLLILFLGRAIGAWLKLAPRAISALALATVFCNSGNFGLSVTEFAFGKEAVALALICFVTDNLMVNSLGVYLAARDHANARAAAQQVFGNPALYALPLGLLAHQVGWVAPIPLGRALEMLSRATVPVMLIVLGMQLAALPFKRSDLGVIGLATVLRLIIAPIIAAILVVPFGLTGLPRQVSILEAAVPTAVMSNIVASRYNSGPNIVAGSVLVTSLFSLITITVLLTLMH